MSVTPLTNRLRCHRAATSTIHSAVGLHLAVPAERKLKHLDPTELN